MSVTRPLAEIVDRDGRVWRVDFVGDDVRRQPDVMVRRIDAQLTKTAA